ncbi:MAG: P1 family peptidase [Betaproteobacteria bacterium]|nr:P1 family peptidase [Betaproteobacteria bacterium]
MENRTITGIPGLLAGHTTDLENRTGCTAILCPQGFTPGVALPGFAPGSRETDLLRPESSVDAVHGILFAGGSAFGLAAADGVIRFLRERGIGFAMPHAVIPLVPGAVIYDLDMNRKAGSLPDAAMGYAAAVAASDAPLAEGAVGAGTGARCGRLFSMGNGPDYTEKSGLGSALLEWKGIQVAALVVVNALGNIHDPVSGAFLAGGRDATGRPFGRDAMLTAVAGENLPQSNTVLTLVATNAPLDKVQATRLARMAGTGLARSIVPAHLAYDGDIVFALASKQPLPVGVGNWTDSLLGTLGAEAVALAAARSSHTCISRHKAPSKKLLFGSS